ncbi:MULTISPECIES: cobaltochelatase subunit CobN [Rhodopseudomonas]|uniref:Cobaltochelatase subunit CobN n=1 Tax=Rhodopseudomonas palustris TaxID=1076 RepID=A0A0D7F252_RHOPL|nr:MULTISPECIES: cobaltochelatase subunit CobN [Rhodopseudomonas]KIZ46875.1 cobalamin biosynthesis protein CobN [Rhodopseudomonas palustris]MDF3814519.1 cobaltochelatase subunit CobN [Rhodopseudomonas sp. BAL398]WOK20774.1 cobaltochelatase subunit CobN [Rhodopseudomonas sp. BAL398]
MHLKLDQGGTIDDGAIARDLGQETADIVVLSAADSDLAAFAAAHATLPKDYPSLRLTNLLALGHPASVDAYVERTLRGAKIVLLRMLGGESYWPHGVESLRADALRRGTLFACVPGEMAFDPALAARGTVDLDDSHALWRYCSEGGVDNAQLALRYAAYLIMRDDAPPPARPMPAAGFWPAEPAPTARRNALVIFYRALVAGSDTAAIDALRSALDERGLNPVCLYVTSLKDARSAAFLRAALAAYPPDVIINATAFATATASDDAGVLAASGCPVLQVAQAAMSQEAWQASSRGLNPRDLAMHVVLPEVDGRLFAGVVAFKQRNDSDADFTPTLYHPLADRVDAVAELAWAWVRLRRLPPHKRRVAIVLANYPNRDGRLGNGVGLDTPQSLVDVLMAMRDAGYASGEAPGDAATLVRILQDGPTNALADRAARIGGVAWPVADYKIAFATLPENVRRAVEARWGNPADDPHVVDGSFRLGLHRFDHVLVGVQPARGYNIDPQSSFHDPDLVPPHHYLAFYLWIRRAFDAHAVVHLGKHGNLEWLPGKSAGLSQDCFPTAVLGPLPQLYPFIVNDPGEGVQAKRRTAAVIIDHLTPPMTRAELHGDLARLENLVDEYALATDLDPTRADAIAQDILSVARAQRLDADIHITRDTPTYEALRALDAHLCDLKEMQIRDGLHIFGSSPPVARCNDLLVSIARLPRSELAPRDASLHRALARDLGLGDFDPLTRDLVDDYVGPCPVLLAGLIDAAWRSVGDTVERIEALALRLVAGDVACDPAWSQTRAVLDWINATLRPAVEACGAAEMRALLQGLDGQFVRPGPSGAPTRGRPDVLPTGRNFFAVDVRAVPTPSAWRIGKLAAERLVEAYWQEAGDWPRAIALSAWGTANMRTGGDDVAQALALIGARPVWEQTTGRVTGFAITSLSELRRPRIDVTFRVSGLFRDAFPTQMDIIGSAVRAIAELDEPHDANPIAANVRARARELEAGGIDPATARRQAAWRVFGSKPGAYGAGLQALIDEGGWDRRGDLAESYLAWGGYAYGAGDDGEAARDAFAARLTVTDLVAQTQDNREHDILDSDDYYQFIGGLAATVQSLRGTAPRIAHIDTSRPEAPLPRPLAHEISRVVRGRAANPKWIQGAMRHGYKGAFEIAATVDYLFGFAASTDAVGSHHFDQLFAAYLEDEQVRDFMRDANPAALAETAARFAEAIRRGLWTPRANCAADLIADLLPNPKDPA